MCLYNYTNIVDTCTQIVYNFTCSSTTKQQTIRCQACVPLVKDISKQSFRKHVYV